MEITKIWVLLNHKGEFVKACSTREKALEAMKAWRENFIKIAPLVEVSKIDAVYEDRITFKVTGSATAPQTFIAKSVVLD